MKRYSQRDPQWKSTLLGFDSQATLGDYGCLLTDIAMVASVYGFNETPVTLNDKMKAVQGFQGAFVIPSLIGKALPGMIYRDYLECHSQPAPLAEIDASLALGKPVIVEVDFSPRAGLQDHWLVLRARQDDDYLIQDPWPVPAETKDVTLSSRFGFAGKAGQVIQAVLWLDGPGGAVTPPVQPNLDTGVAASFKVYATVADLAIRSQTLVADSTLIKRVPLGTQFTVLEKDATATPKIGQVNQWLAVKAADGTVGYVAAWYVSLEKPVPPAGPAAPPPAQPAGSQLVVRTTADGVALRSKSQISAATLVKRLGRGSDLAVTEPQAGAGPKIGVPGNWLQVKDISGQAGWVAAGYVSLAGTTSLGVQPAAGPAQQPAAAAAPVLLTASQDGLALRSQPVIRDDTLIKRLWLGAELAVTEPPAGVLPKIGQAGQWIAVRDVTGAGGYVAAWYVTARPQLPAPTSGPADS